MFIFLNGELIPSEQATISIYDHGYLYGLGLFETFRTYGGQPFLLGKHLDRLEEGCQQVGMNWQRDDQRIVQQVSTLLKENHLQDGYFRYNVSAGPHPIGLPNDPYTDLTEALFVKELPPSVCSKQLSTVHTKRNTPEGEFRLKSHHYLNNVLAKRETSSGVEGIFLTREDKVAEGIVSNLFFVRDQELYTPSLSTGILNGVTRQVVMEIAKREGIIVHEGEYHLEFAQNADEVFVTNSIQEVVPVCKWDACEYKGVGEEAPNVENRKRSTMYSLKQGYSKYVQYDVQGN